MKAGHIAIFFTLFAAVSCKKHGPSPVVYSSDMMAMLPDSLLTGYNTALITPPGTRAYDVYGILCAERSTIDITDTAGTNNSYMYRTEKAYFTNSTTPSSYVLAGNVSVNNVNLPLDSMLYGVHVVDYSCYQNYDVSNTWLDNSVNHWMVSGGEYTPPIDAYVPATFPDFTGTLPHSFSHTSDLSFTFNSSNTTDADSAYIILYFTGFIFRSNTVSAKNGVATISAASLHAELNDNNYQEYSSSALINVVVYTDTVQTFNNKRFAFIKQRSVTASIAIN